ncbi:MAG TPA: ATP-dependent Clp protease proteolytic subunit [Polyangiaceae bacterium]|nr:ATP-dependent Clp protease proteolytic subunit [Polyangiaceae bacterium]
MSEAPGQNPRAEADDATGRVRVERRLYESRTVLVFGEIDIGLAERVSGQLLALASEDHRPIRVLVNSPGGHVEAGDTIYDVLRFIEPPVTILGTGWVASAGASIFCAAPRERRLSLPNTRFLLHQPSGGAGGPASDIEIEAMQILSVRTRLNRIFAEATGHTLEKIARDTERNHWLNAQEALNYGLVGRIIEKASELGSPLL